MQTVIPLTLFFAANQSLLSAHLSVVATDPHPVLLSLLIALDQWKEDSLKMIFLSGLFLKKSSVHPCSSLNPALFLCLYHQGWEAIGPRGMAKKDLWMTTAFVDPDQFHPDQFHPDHFSQAISQFYNPPKKACPSLLRTTHLSTRFLLQCSSEVLHEILFYRENPLTIPWITEQIHPMHRKCETEHWLWSQPGSRGPSNCAPQSLCTAETQVCAAAVSHQKATLTLQAPS